MSCSIYRYSRSRMLMRRWRRHMRWRIRLKKQTIMRMKAKSQSITNSVQKIVTLRISIFTLSANASAKEPMPSSE